MPRRYLFGPVTPAYAAQSLSRALAAKECVPFDPAGTTGFAIGPADTWADVCSRLPAGWEPDALVLYLPYTSVPEGLWDAPVPIIGLAADWNLQWHHYRRCLPRCDVVFTDQPGVDLLARAGIASARAVNLFACEQAFLDGPWPGTDRDIDVLFVGNLHPAVQGERLSWLGRLAKLASRWRVAIQTNVYGEAYRQLLARARIVFNRSIRGECNRRCFEAAAAGALFFQESGNAETEAFFRAGQECVAYTEQNLEALLQHYLEHEEERRVLADAARHRVRQFAFEDVWDQALASLEPDWPTLQERCRNRARRDADGDFTARAWQAVGSTTLPDPSLIRALARAVAEKPRSAALHNAFSVVAALVESPQTGLTPAVVQLAAASFRRAVQADPTHFVAALNLVEALSALGQKEEAVERGRQGLALIDRTCNGPPSWLDAPYFPPGFDCFRVEWERAAWGNAGNRAGEVQCKRALLRWRLHALLADLTLDLVQYHEAALARPDLPVPRAALGCALARAGRVTEALPHLERAVTGNPFDLLAARAYFQALGDAGDRDGQRRFARERRLLAQAAPQVVPPESWFEQAGPVGDELASIVVLCCNQLDYTKQCMESVLRHTRTPYELVLIDNGSSDGTVAYLEQLRARLGPARVEVIRNATNVGFPAGCNQGIGRARGTHVVFLNNDTVVTPGWMDGLISWIVRGWPRVGLVGAVTNASRPPQEIPVDYADLADIDAFARRRQASHAGQALQTERLTGFCMLARRDVLDRIGGFDEDYGTGFFDDDDLCVRARKAGFDLLVAQDVFVHHFGSRTFRGLSIDTTSQLKENFARFQAKWGPDEAAGYRLPAETPAVPEPDHVVNDAPIAASATAERPRVSLCIIAKNEEPNIADCIRSAGDLCGEVVVVDTGSTDRTKEIAADLGAKVFDFPWQNSFAAARNETIDRATGEWIFWLDADDRLDEANRAKLRQLFAALPPANVAYSMKCLCLPDARGGSGTLVDHIRLFRNHPRIRWQFRVHEQILPAVRDAGGQVLFADVVIQHTGYCDHALRQKKLQRDLRLLHLQDAETPDDPFTLFNLGAVSQELGKHAEAIPLLRRSLVRSAPSDSIVRKIYAFVAGCHRALHQPDDALAACQEGRKLYADDTELLFVEGQLRRDRGELDLAEACFQRLLTEAPPPHFASVDAGLRGHKTRHNLAVVYQLQKRWAEAEAQWRLTLEECRDFLPSWLALGDLYMTQGRWADLDSVAARLEALPEGALDGTVLRARGHLARKDFAQARCLLEPATAKNPRALWPHVILSHVLLQEGRDSAAAEQVLRDILALAPDHAEAKHNLGILLRNQNRPLDDFVAGKLTLADLYQRACTADSDIREHLPTLHELASKCRHVTEFGTRSGVSTTALLFAQPDTLVAYDTVKYPQVDWLKALAGRTRFRFVQADVLQVEIAETDLLFIDTWHVYEQLKEELHRHAGKVRKYVVLHDTTTFGERGETAGHRGLWPAVEEFLAEGGFGLRERWTNNNGLAILEKLPTQIAS